MAQRKHNDNFRILCKFTFVRWAFSCPTFSMLKVIFRFLTRSKVKNIQIGHHSIHHIHVRIHVIFFAKIASLLSNYQVSVDEIISTYAEINLKLVEGTVQEVYCILLTKLADNFFINVTEKSLKSG